MVKKVLMATLALLALSMIIPQSLAMFYFRPAVVRSIPPIVSTDWLEWNLNRGNLVVLDVRGEDAYNAGHIPGAINVPEGNWYINPPFGPDLPWMEMPPIEDLLPLIGDAGISRYSWVVVVGATSGPVAPEEPWALYGTAGITRVAITLLYARIKNVAILDGGHDKWAVEGKPLSTDPVTPIPVTYMGTIDETMLVTAGYVEEKIGISIIVDARDEVVYDGTVTEPWAPDPGHIETARNLPTPTLWNIELGEGGIAVYITYKDMEALWSMALSVVGWNWRWCREIIVYCGVGGYASTAYFVLSEVLQFSDVRLYDGSTQEWNGMLGKPLVT